MAYFKRGWNEGLQLLAEWWDAVHEYATEIGDGGNAKPPGDFYRQNTLLCKFIREVAKVDPLPIWELGKLIERREGIVGSRKDGTNYYATRDPHAKASDIVNAVYRAVHLKDKLFDMGTTNKKAGRPTKATTETAKKLLLEDGASVDQVTARLDISADNARQIRSRSRRRNVT